MRAVRIPTSARRILISVNPQAGARSGRPQVERLAASLRERRYDVELLEDIDAVSATAAERLRDGELRAVVAAGGDGTAALVANRTPHETPLALLPLGTENLLSKYLGVSPDPVVVGDVIHRGLSVRLDAGQANGSIFLLMVGCGFDAEVVRRVHAARTGHIHHLSYAKPILDSICNYRYPLLRVRCEAPDDGGTAHEFAARWAFVVNLSRYAGGLNFAPRAVGTDGLLDLCTFREGSLWRGLWYLGHVMRGSHDGLDSCTVLQTRRIRIESDSAVPYQLDGDPGGRLPVDVEVLPQRLNMIVPATWVRRQRIRLAGRLAKRTA